MRFFCPLLLLAICLSTPAFAQTSPKQASPAFIRWLIKEKVKVPLEPQQPIALTQCRGFHQLPLHPPDSFGCVDFLLLPLEFKFPGCDKSCLWSIAFSNCYALNSFASFWVHRRRHSHGNRQDVCTCFASIGQPHRY